MNDDSGPDHAKREERLDRTPVAIPTRFNRPVAEFDRLRAMVRGAQFMQELQKVHIETFDEADDFDTGEDDPLPISAYEAHFDPSLQTFGNFVDQVAPVESEKPAPAEPAKAAEPEKGGAPSPEPKA